MGAHNALYDLMDAVTNNPVQDPGASGTFDINSIGSGGYCDLTTAGSESRALPAMPVGCQLLVNQLGSHAVTVTDSDGTVATMAQNETALLISVSASASKWRALLFKYGVT